MIVFILYLILIFTVLVLSLSEKKNYKNYFSPFTLLSIPYVVIITYQIIVINIYKWQPISSIYLIFVLLFLVNFYITGNIFLYCLNKTYNKLNLRALSGNTSYTKGVIKKNSKRIRVLELLSIFSAIYLILFFLMNARVLPNIGMIVQDEFQSVYESGINFYLRLICMVGTTYFWGLTNQNNKKFFFLGFLCFIPNFFTFVKGIAFIVILGGILANYMLYKRTFKINLLIRILILGILLFFLVYMVEIGIWDINKLLSKDTYKFIYAKLNVYLISGVQSFNINISNTNTIFQDLPNPVYAPIINAFHKLGLSERINSINNIWVNIGYIPNYGNVYVNTNTYIGTLVLYCGFVKGMLINSLIAFFIYDFFWKAIKTNSTLDVIRYSLMVTGIILGWFEYYYMHTFWFYLIMLFGLIKLINCITLKKTKVYS